MAKKTVTTKAKRLPRKTNGASASKKLQDAPILDSLSEVKSLSRGRKVAFAAGAVGILAMLASKTGRKVLKTVGGLALPIVAGVAETKIAARIADSV